MFGFQGGESADTVARKKSYMQDARQQWGFLTHCREWTLDPARIHPEGQTSRTRHFSRDRDRLSSSGSSRHEQGQS
jgi:hypothetical protein